MQKTARPLPAYAHLHALIRAHFMAQQDVRCFLNRLLLDFDGIKTLQAVATDGHRLATNAVEYSSESPALGGGAT